MISTLVTYMIEVSLCWLVLLGFYQLFLRRLSFNHLSRIYLLMSIFAGLAIPLLPNFHTEAPQFVYTFQGQLDELAVTVNGYTHDRAPTSFDWQTFLFGTYLLIAVALLVRIFLGMLKIYRIQPVKKEKLGDAEVYYHDLPMQPFSFINRIFIPQNYPEKYLDIIHRHELAHVENGHSIDVLCIRLVRSVFWINPMVGLFELFLKEVHEQFADDHTLMYTDYSTYRKALQFSAFAALGIPLAQAFNSNQIRKRLKKMKKSKSRIPSKIYYALALPLVILLSLAMNATDRLDLNEFVTDGVKMNMSDWADSESTAQTSPASDTVPPPPAPPAPPTPPEPGKAPSPPAVDEPVPASPPVPSMSDPVPPPPPPSIDGKVMKVVQEMPRFPGCDESQITDEKERIRCSNIKLIEYMSEKLVYPDEAEKWGVDGTVIIQFTVTKDGYVKDAVISKNIGKGCGEAALKVVEGMNQMKERWIPGRKDGKPVNVQFLLPVKFKLDPPGSKTSKSTSISSEDEIYKLVDQMPRFPGCEDLSGEARKKCSMQKLLEFLYENVKYPEEAKKAGIEGTTVVQFVVDKDGGMQDLKLLRNVDGGCGDESLRVLQQMKDENIRWIPGKKDGKIVSVQYNLPIKFKL